MTLSPIQEVDTCRSLYAMMHPCAELSNIGHIDPEKMRGNTCVYVINEWDQVLSYSTISQCSGCWDAFT